MSLEHEQARLKEIKQSTTELLSQQESLYPGDFFDRALELAAQKGDTQCILQGKASQFEHALGDVVTNDTRVREERKKGSFADYTADKHSPKEFQTIIDVAKLIAKHVDPNICYYSFIHESIAGKNLSQGLEKWKAREQDMSALPQEMKSLVYAHLMKNVAEQKLRERARSLLDESTRLDLIQKDPNDYWSDMLAGDPLKTGSSPVFALAFGKRVGDKILEKAKTLFGTENDAKRALRALASVTYMTKKEYGGRDFSEFRTSVYASLAQKDIDQAERILTEKVQKYPKAFTPTAREAFGKK